jgi:mRNA-degrading endonuclease RelE of RelBE toxin-antitoxin system
VLPINPIVQQYDSCKLSLSLINQQYNVPKFEKTFEEQEPMLQSPVKEDNMINDSVRKKIENLERENEQAGIKIGRLEQDCGFYRARIGDFVVRIKNIVSSQNKQVHMKITQNSYLKKSPMTLTLEKLEQSMASILRKTTEMGRTSNF